MRKKYIEDNNTLLKKFPNSKFVGKNKILQEIVFDNCRVENCFLSAPYNFTNLNIKDAKISEIKKHNTTTQTKLNIDAIKNFDKNYFDGMKIAIDGTNAEMMNLAKNLFDELHSFVVVKKSSMEKTANISSFSRWLIKEKAQIGFWFFENSEKLVAVNSLGQILCGDDILYLLAWWLNNQNKLSQKQVVGTLETSLGIENKLKSLGISLLRETSNQAFYNSMQHCDLSVNYLGEITLKYNDQTIKNPLFIARILASIYHENKNIWIKVKENKYVKAYKKIPLKENLKQEEIDIIKTIFDFYALKIKGVGRVVNWFDKENLCFMVESLEKTTAIFLSAEIRKKIIKYLKIN